jgi:hypothetical protein
MVTAILPPLAAILATAAVAVNVEDIISLAFGGPVDGWRLLMVIGILFLPIGLTLVLTECFMRGRCGRFGKRE